MSLDDYIAREQTRILWELAQEQERSLRESYVNPQDPNLEKDLKSLYFELSRHPNITWGIIQAHPEKPWDYGAIPNSVIPLDVLLNNFDKAWARLKISTHPDTSWEVIKNNRHLRWPPVIISRNERVVREILEAEGGRNLRWDRIPVEGGGLWSFATLSENSSVTWELVLANWGEFWLSCKLLANAKISIEVIKENRGKFYNVADFSRNPNVTWEIVQAHPEFPWNYVYLSMNPNITWDIVQANPTKPWSYKRLSANPNITLDIIQAHPEKPWDYELFSRNKNFSRKLVVDNPGYGWTEPLQFEIAFYSQNIVERCTREWNAANKIKEFFLQRFWSPYTKLGKKRLERSYHQENYSVW